MSESFGIIGGADGPTAVAMGGMFVVFLVFYFLVIFLALAFSIASYVLHSLGLYTVANRRGIRNAWLAWIPFGNVWLLGSISDQYQYVAKGKIKNRRKMLLALNVLLVSVYVFLLIYMISNALYGYMGAMMAGMGIGWLAVMAVCIALYVIEYVAYYDLFRSCQPSNGVLYLVLSILCPVTLPFFVFFIRKKDLGMPPRKQPVAADAVVNAAAEAPAEAPAEEPTVGVDAFGDPSATEETNEETTEETTEE